MVKILDNTIKGLYNVAGEKTEDVKGTVVINTPNVNLKDMTITGDLIIAEGVGEGDVKLDNVKIKGDTIIRGGGIEKVVIPASIAAGQNIVLQGNFKTVENNGTNLNIQATGSIGSLILNQSATVSGTASITDVTTVQGAESVVNGSTIQGGQTGVTPPGNTGGGSSSSGNSGTVVEKTTPTITTPPECGGLKYGPKLADIGFSNTPKASVPGNSPGLSLI